MSWLELETADSGVKVEQGSGRNEGDACEGAGGDRKYITKGCDASKLTIPELEAVACVELATTLKGKDG